MTRTQKINVVCSIIVYPVMAWLLIRYALMHGEAWEFGSMGMPEPLIVGFRYKNGDKVDPTTFTLHEQGLHQAFMWGGVIFTAAMWRYWWAVRKYNRSLMEQNELLRQLIEEVK